MESVVISMIYDGRWWWSMRWWGSWWSYGGGEMFLLLGLGSGGWIDGWISGSC